ncbi:MAG: hypothetical protein ACI35W_05330 [Anaeroplasmataceae bacterium]
MELVAIIVFLAVILLAMLNARIYNFIHGFVSFFGIAAILCFVAFLLNKFAPSAAVTAKYAEAIVYVNAFIVLPLVSIFDFFKLSFLTDLNQVTFYIVLMGVWIISSVISIALRRARRNRE